MKVKTSELSGVQLDYAVAWSVDWGQPVLHITSGGSFVELMGVVFSPTSNWSQCGPLIEQYDMNVSAPFFGCEAWANIQTGSFGGAKSWKGVTCQEAICRAVVAAKLGDEVDIPDELMEVGE